MVELLNVHDYPRGLPPNTIRIGRPSVWGNPYNITERRNRAESVIAFRAYATRRLAGEPDWLEPLRGKNLACYCTPMACHGDVLMELLYGRS